MQQSLLFCPTIEGDPLSSIIKQSIAIDSKLAAKVLYGKARNFERDLSSLIHSFETNGSELKGLKYKLKSTQSLARKLSGEAEKAGGMANITMPGDVIRYTLIVHKWLAGKTFVNTVKNCVHAITQAGFEIIKVENYFINHGRSYDGVNCIFHDRKKNQSFELQFHVPWSFWLKMEDHHEYEEIRVIKDPVKRKRMMWKYDNEVRFGKYREKMRSEGFTVFNIPHIQELETIKNNNRSLAFSWAH